ncbi:hypothetical protein M407DRAFT_241548 [Tulasnella calospora MUT 4182]|uniref:Uncharacterized protein n=1 Tax=Tulasnella calospora MUT 4182 TaxID=1051891 RepID=A0A0C3QUG2_9AGAM|nr:hypothetical protein M407DRAFT_241548 [Tulasnella calospora MUT 4182]
MLRQSIQKKSCGGVIPPVGTTSRGWKACTGLLRMVRFDAIAYSDSDSAKRTVSPRKANETVDSERRKPKIKVGRSTTTFWSLEETRENAT